MKLYSALLLVLALLFSSGCGGSGDGKVSDISQVDAADAVIIGGDTSIPPFLPPPPVQPEIYPEGVGPMKVHILSVNQADAIFIETPDYRRILIDGGQGDDVVKRLRTLGVWGKTLDLVVLTHPHVDHVRGLLYVLNGCPVKEIWETGVQDNSPIPNVWYSEFHRRVGVIGIPVRKVKAGKIGYFGGARLKVLAPLTLLDGKSVEIVNDASIVIEASYGRCKALLTGDAQVAEQRSILSKLTHAQLLKVPHHGAYNAALSELYQKTTPNVSVITVGLGSNFIGLPDPRTVSMIPGRKYLTWRDGTVIATMNGTTTRYTTLSD